MALKAALESIVQAAPAAPVDYTTIAGDITTVMSGLGAGLGLVIVAALGVKGITWGVPKIVRFFTKLA